MMNDVYPAFDLLNNTHVSIFSGGIKGLPSDIGVIFPLALHMRCAHQLIGLMQAKLKSTFIDSPTQAIQDATSSYRTTNIQPYHELRKKIPFYPTHYILTRQWQSPPDAPISYLAISDTKPTNIIVFSKENQSRQSPHCLHQTVNFLIVSLTIITIFRCLLISRVFIQFSRRYHYQQTRNQV